MTDKAPSMGDRMLLGRMMAGIAILERSGCGSVELAYDDDLPEPVPVQWWCGGNRQGTRVYSERYPYPSQAVEDLLSRVLNGGLCRRCNSPTLVGVEVAGYCCFMLTADDVADETTYRYDRTCEVT